MGRLLAFYLALLGTVAVTVAVEVPDRGPGVVTSLAFAPLASTVLVMLVAPWMFLRATNREALTAGLAVGLLPFALWWLLDACNVGAIQGYGVYPFLGYVLGCGLCALGLLFAVAIRAIVRHFDPGAA